MATRAEIGAAEPPFDWLGIDVGSVSVKLCALARNGQTRSAVVSHEGDLPAAFEQALTELGLPYGWAGLALATGGSGRHRLRVPEVIAPQAVEAALEALGLRPRAVVTLGGEDLVVYPIDEQGRVQSCFGGNKCASGTGEFFRQQLGRMDLALAELETAAAGARLVELSARCSVFMKSDCTHRLNKGEASRGDIALSLSRVMANKVGEFLIKAKIQNGQVVLTGGVTRNRFLIEFLRAAAKETEFLVPAEACFFEAFGAAELAQKLGRPLPGAGGRLVPRASTDYGTLEPLPSAAALVRTFPSRRRAPRPDAEYVLGVDGGSTTTKIVLVEADSAEIVAAHYGRTHGDPVAALKGCVREVLQQLGPIRPRIRLCATTGSSRELLGVFLETDGVYNEIIAHAEGTMAFAPEVDTLFEIGGQDAKYVLLQSGVPIDYAMNEACSAGTGSFLEESASGDLNVERAEDIGPLALEARAPLKFGEHCSAFINSDVRKAIGQGAARSDIVAGLVFSVVANYLNRVVGNRPIGQQIALQGGVARNPAVPLAFAQLLGKSIVVPPDPELLGALGVALLARRKHAEGLLGAGQFDLEAILDKPFKTRSELVCKSCENRCPIRLLDVAGRRYPFGGRCSKFTGARRRGRAAFEPGVDYVAWRTSQMFERFGAPPADWSRRDWRTVGVPRALSVHSLWPLYSRYFHELGLEPQLSERVVPEGVARQESNYCFPLEIAHGAIQDLLDRRVDFLFLPHFRDMPSLEQGRVHACVCPLTQGLPYLARRAFDLDPSRVLQPVVSFKQGWSACRGEFVALAEQLGRPPIDGGRAFDRALEHYQRFVTTYRRRGQELLAEIREHPERLYVALLGRPYNAFTRDANMGIPRKLTSRGVTVLPYDLIHDEEAEIFPNMYWHYGQQDLRVVRQASEIPNLLVTWISNFSCAPDSFMLHYLRWMMGDKPYLVLEIDSHTADAGLDTRIEAFLDVVEGYRRRTGSGPRRLGQARYRTEIHDDRVVVADAAGGEKVPLRDRRVTLLWPSMGDLASQCVAATARKQGIRSAHLPVADVRSTQLARNVASGKECIPALLVLGSVLQWIERNQPSGDEILLVYVPSTLGPCRTGQYHVFYERLFAERGLDQVVLLVGESENSYREFGPGFTRDLWRAVVLGDLFTDVRTAIRLLATDPAAGLATFDDCWREVIEAVVEGTAALDRALERAQRALGAIARRRSLADLKKVLVVGEIYVRRDDFSVRELCDHLVERGIFPKLADVAEWIHYTDWSMRYLLDAERRQKGLVREVRRGWLRERGTLALEQVWKHLVERDLRRKLEPTGLVPSGAPGVDDALGAGCREFVSPELESEATLSPAVAAAAMQDGFSGVAIIAPFGCLPGRLIEAVYAPWARSRGYPVVALENDGQPYPPNVISRLEVFSHNVARYRREAQPR